jgi:hypothetical protein
MSPFANVKSVSMQFQSLSVHSLSTYAITESTRSLGLAVLQKGSQRIDYLPDR